MSTSNAGRPFVRALLWAVLASTLLLCVACGSDDEATGPSGQDLDVVGDGAPFGGRFDDVPLHPRSDPVGEPSEEGDTVARSYVVRGASTDQVMAFYQDSLPPLGWSTVLEPEQSGTSTVQAEWTDGDLLLRISASDAAALGGDQDPTEAVRTQYSLVMSQR